MTHFGVARPELEHRQLEKLQALLGILLGRNHFYAARLHAAGLGPELESLDEFIQRCPFTTKHDLQEDQRLHPPYGSNLSYPLEAYSRHCRTSASTGAALHWLDTRESWQWMLSHWDTVFTAAGIAPSQAIFFAFSFGPFLGFWTAFDAAQRRGNLVFSGGGMNTQSRLDMLQDTRPQALCCTPTYALRLGEVAAEKGIDLGELGVRAIVVAGEPGGSVPVVRERIEKLWQARVFDHHGMTETGPVSYPCPARDNVLHVIEDDYLVEIIDPVSGASRSRGAAGELVLTTLGREGRPVLRYRTGDFVQTETVSICECGRQDMALPGGIVSRTDDMLVVRGVNVYPSAIDALVRALPEIAEYQVEVRRRCGLAELALTIEVLPGSDAQAAAQAVAERLQSALALRIAASVVPSGSLPRFEMKAKRWVFSNNGMGLD